MCRLFGAISTHSIDADYLLRTAPHSLLRQSDIDKKRKQGDGWGVGWFEKGRPRVFKSPKPMYRDKLLVRRAGVRASGRALIGHVRWASNPLKLKRSELIGLAHTQPFVHGKWMFAHNGTVYIPKEVAAQMGRWRKYIKGKNDSEVLFYWLMKYLHRAKNPVQAVRQCIQGIHHIWDGCKKSYPIYHFPYHGLNWVLSDGETLLAFCYADPRGFGKSKALCRSKQRYYQLQRQVSRHGVIVASEPLDDRAHWQGFRHGELLITQRQGKRLITRRAQVV